MILSSHALFSRVTGLGFITRRCGTFFFFFFLFSRSFSTNVQEGGMFDFFFVFRICLRDGSLSLRFCVCAWFLFLLVPKWCGAVVRPTTKRRLHVLKSPVVDVLPRFFFLSFLTSKLFLKRDSPQHQEAMDGGRWERNHILRIKLRQRYDQAAGFVLVFWLCVSNLKSSLLGFVDAKTILSTCELGVKKKQDFCIEVATAGSSLWFVYFQNWFSLCRAKLDFLGNGSRFNEELDRGVLVSSVSLIALISVLVKGFWTGAINLRKREDWRNLSWRENFDWWEMVSLKEKEWVLK